MGLAYHRNTAECYECGGTASQIITAPLLVKASADVCYDSPIDGRPVTSHAQRQEDMKRAQCVPYDPDMKVDQLRRIQAQDAAMDHAIESQVEEAVSKMPTATRAKLYSEVVEQGFDCTVERITPGV